MNVLFSGELYPNVVHGISIANRLNIDCLEKSSAAQVDTIAEQSDVGSIGRVSCLKIYRTLLLFSHIYFKSRVKKYECFYFVVSLSPFGILKNLIQAMAFCKGKTGLIACHLHRGDFVEFYRSGRTVRFLIGLCFRRVDRLIVLSYEQKDEMSKYFRGTISVVENTVLEEGEICEANANLGRNGFIYLSNYYKAKGIYDLTAAFEFLPDSFVQCYGEFDGNEEELRRVAPSSVVVNGPIQGLHKFQALSQSDALIFPSWNEGQPTVILEAMLVSTPVITTKVGLISDMLGDDYPFYFEPKNPDSLLSCVRRFAQLSQIERASLGKKLNERYWSRFSQENHKKKLFDAFQIGVRGGAVGKC